MSYSFEYIDIILLAMIAGFIFLRLRGILGKKTGFEEDIDSSFAHEAPPSKSTVDLNASTFDENAKKEFVKGAKIAYETIITSFAKGDQNKLDELLTRDMASNFKQAISERNKNGIKSELTFISMKESDLEKYEKIKTNLYATVKFVSEIISVKRDKDNKVIEGNPDRIKTVTDHWKFTKNILNKSPNWYLTEITNK